MGSRMLSDTGYRGVCIQSMGNFDDDISKGLEEKTVSGIILARTSTGYICRKVLILKGENHDTSTVLFGQYDGSDELYIRISKKGASIVGIVYDESMFLWQINELFEILKEKEQ